MEEVFSLISGGDVYINRDDPKTAFKGVENILIKGDISFVNLETSLTNIENPLSDRLIPMKADPKMIEGYVEGGIDIVTLANNHTNDFGSEGLLDTIETVENNGIIQVGAGHNYEEAHSPKIIKKNNIDVAFLGYECTQWSFGGRARKTVPGVSKIDVSGLLPEPHVDKLDFENMKEDVKRANEEADFVVVSFHFGLAPFSNLASHQPFLAKEAIDAGADIIIGHHPHRLQGIEVYKGKLICYSLGNLIFDEMHKYPQTSLLVETNFSENGLEEVFLYPIFIEKSEKGLFEPKIAEEKEYKKVLKEIEKLSEDLKSRFIDRGNKVEVVLDQ